MYREDLAHYPANLWSLTGLAQALQAQGRNELAARAQSQSRLALAGSPHQPRNSRF